MSIRMTLRKVCINSPFETSEVKFNGPVEFAYMIRRVELKNRAVVEGDSPWSIRQTAVYHRLESNIQDCETSQKEESQPVQTVPRSVFLLLSQSENVEMQFADSLKQTASNNEYPPSPWNIHRIFIADCLRGWMDYMAYIEQRLKQQVT